MNNLLKPCPFCGATAETKQKERNGLYKVVANHDEDCVFAELQWFGGYYDEETAVEAWNRRVKPPEINIYNKEETYTDCTVQVLTNTATGETSVGWWKNDAPPAGMERDNE